MPLLSNDEKVLIRKVIDAFRPADCATSVHAAAARAEAFLHDLAASGSERVEEIRLLLAVLLGALFPVGLLSRHDVRKRLTELEERTVLLGIGDEVQRGLARFAQRLSFLCLYGTLDANGKPAAAEQLGYQVFEERRPGAPPALPAEPILPPEVIDPWAASGSLAGRRHDVVVIGSGAGGAVVARRLVEDHGLDVGVIELGDYVPEGRDSAAPDGRRRPRVHDEIENLLAYYKHAGLQLTQGHPMFIFQGQCLGGSSVVNNAVCFRMRDWSRTAWAAAGADWALAGGDLDASYGRIASDLEIGSAANLAQRLNPSGEFLRLGAIALGLKEPQPCDVNLTHLPQCLGCGYCNLTCGYLRKRSVLQTMLPAAAAASLGGRGRLTIYAGLKANSLAGDGKDRATSVEVRGRSAALRHRRGRIKARKFVIAAGAIGSSGILERSSGIGSEDLPIGKRLSCNFGSPVHAEYEQAVRAFDGLQIAHYWEGGAQDGFVIETWYNPPAQQSLALPGWMDQLMANLRSYAHYACAAPLVGSSAESEVDARWFGAGEDIRMRFRDVDLARLKKGLKVVCELFFAGTPRPRRVLLGTLDSWTVNERDYAARIDGIRELTEIQIGTGHPQGGNVIGRSPGSDAHPGVVGGDLRVFGTRNVWVADASVFPASLGVNPHWTVMAVADLAARRIAEA